MSDQNGGSQEPEREEPVVRDKRRIDPETGKVRQPEGEQKPEEAGEHDLAHEELVDVGPAESEDEETILSDDDLDILSGQTTAEQLAAERLADLQRVTAEYANYRKRTEANRELERERAVGDAVKGLIPVLDDLERAEKHGDLGEGSAFTTIAAKLRTAVERLGLTPYGEKGEPFDPQIHEAIFQQPTPDVTADTVAEVVETGYRLGSTIVRVAKVVVSVPA
ncbi:MULTISPECIES: nucleotide exchange factor GrpE [unclassified Leifsonia]|uniref:nucleotide exchange factor GrpE n=1 Tax=unclassified Leifsonia TaxID=2663824 RepID=UPI0008A7C3FF|nr:MULTISPECIES: nucleotide exchange factor GrpE [unclassified Leifsonia]SEI11071.1 molecular chaperone GrpE [Leifsonia sp. CL154]SFL89454.1 molecular chaperone GrpE [Leifsonia sp. CL147]